MKYVSNVGYNKILIDGAAIMKAGAFSSPAKAMEWYLALYGLVTANKMTAYMKSFCVAEDLNPFAGSWMPVGIIGNFGEVITQTGFLIEGYIDGDGNTSDYALLYNELTNAYDNVVGGGSGGGGGLPYVLPIAGAETLGGVKVGNNLSIDQNGVLSAPAPTAPYVLPTAGAETLGGVKVGNNLSIDENGVLSALGGGGGGSVEPTTFTAVDGVQRLYYNGVSTYAVDLSGLTESSQLIISDNLALNNKLTDVIDKGCRIVTYYRFRPIVTPSTETVEPLTELNFVKSEVFDYVRTAHVVIPNAGGTGLQCFTISLNKSGTSTRFIVSGKHSINYDV